MDKFEEKEIDSKQIFEGRLLKLRVDTVKLPNGAIGNREIVLHPGAVAVVALTDKDELVLVRQFRRPTGEVLLEIPAGIPRAGESGEEAARRELKEETGYVALEVKKVWEGYTSPGYSNELIRFYFAKVSHRGMQQPDEDEFVEAELVPAKKALDLVRTGKIRDNKTMVGVMIADLARRGEL